MLEKYFPDDICMIIYKKLLPFEKFNSVMLELVRERAMQMLIQYADDFMLGDFVIRPSFIKISDEVVAGYCYRPVGNVSCLCAIPEGAYHYSWTVEEEE